MMSVAITASKAVNMQRAEGQDQYSVDKAYTG